jgi:hypothetical protein
LLTRCGVKNTDIPTSDAATPDRIKIPVNQIVEENPQIIYYIVKRFDRRTPD